MHLTSEQRTLGQENFYAAIGNNLLRRDLLKKVNAQELQSGKGLGNAFFGYEPIEKPVRVAVLGTGDEGSILIGAINPKYVQVVAIADIRPFNQHRAFHGDASNANTLTLRPGLIARYGWKDEEEARQNVKVFGDYKELLDFYKDKEGDEGIEGVIIALPLFLHAPAAINAMRQGYHVLTEKLMAHTVAQCKDMARAAEQYQKHCATGHQRHYNVLYDHAVKMLQSGVLGDLHYIRAQWHRNNRPGADSWKQPIPSGIRPDDGPRLRQAIDECNKLLENQNLSSTEKLLLEERKKRIEDQMTEFNRLERSLASFKGRLNSPNTREADKPFIAKQVAQVEAQIADALLMAGGEHNGFKFKSAEEYGYVTEEMQIDGGKRYHRPAAEELIRWRLYDRTSAGLMAELGSHQLDAASIFIAAMFDGKKQYPLSVSATATRTIFPKDLEENPVDRDVDDHIHCVYDYAGKGYDKDDDLGKLRKITVAYSSINGNGFGGYGETVFGTKGTLLIETEKEAMLYNRAEVNKKTKITTNAQGLQIAMDDEGDPLSAAIGLQATFGDVSRGYCEEIEHWAYCIRENPEADHSKPMPRCYPNVALADAVIALTTNIAAKMDETVEFDPAWFDPKSDATPEAKYAPNDPQFTPNLERYR